LSLRATGSSVTSALHAVASTKHNVAMDLPIRHLLRGVGRGAPPPIHDVRVVRTFCTWSTNGRVVRSALLVICCALANCSPAKTIAPMIDAPRASDAGAASPETFELRWSSGWNRHWAGNAGADHGNDSGTVTIVLDHDGRGRIVDRG